MKTPAIIASLTVAGSIAFAAGQQSGSRQVQGIPSGALAHSMQEEMPQARMAQMMDGCMQGADKTWFTTVHLVGDGCQVLVDQAYGNDINGDGVREYLFLQCSKFLGDGQAQCGCIVRLNEVGIGSEGSTATNSCALDSAALIAFIQSIFPQARWAKIESVFGYPPFGFRDMDDDGDLDLILSLILTDTEDYPFGSPSFRLSKQVWIENTGFQHTTRLTGDLDGDGSVNGPDLGILLANWQN